MCHFSFKEDKLSYRRTKTNISLNFLRETIKATLCDLVQDSNLVITPKNWKIKLLINR